MKQLNGKPISDALEWLTSLETTLNQELEQLSSSDVHQRRKINARLTRLQRRREEYQASLPAWIFEPAPSIDRPEKIP